MDEQKKILESFVSDVRQKQKRTSTSVILISLASVIVGVSVLLYLTNQVKSRIDQINELEMRLQETQQALKEATNLKKYVVPVDFNHLKGVATADPDASKVLTFILEHQDVRWRLGGRSPEEGFDSPGYAYYVLRSSSSANLLLGPGASVRETLLSNLRPRSNEFSIQSGDVIFYKNGYTMFYFVAEIDSGEHLVESKTFVIGMTPLGVTSLRQDFAPFDEKEVRRPFRSDQ